MLSYTTYPLSKQNSIHNLSIMQGGKNAHEKKETGKDLQREKYQKGG